jgi:DNA polymerase/3'-5' exonuclease PolX
MNKDLIDQFVILQMYFRNEGDNGRAIAYSKAVAGLRSVNREITNISHVKNIRGIGPKIIAKVKEYLDTGKIQAVESAKREIQKEVKLNKKDGTLLEFQTIWGIGPKKAESLYDAGIHSISDLKKHKELLTSQQIIGLKYREELLQKVPRNMITSLYVMMMYCINKKYGKKTYDMVIAGSYRRGVKESGDIDCLITSKHFTLKDVVSLLEKEGIITDVLSMRNEKFMGIVHCPGSLGHHIRLDIEFVEESEFGSALLYFTGSKGTNMYMRSEAKRKGLLLNEHGLFDSKTGRKVLDYPTEEDIFERIGIPYIPPERR